MAKKNYTDEFRAEAVKLAREAKRAGKKRHVVAREIGVHPNTLADWLLSDDLANAGTGKNTRGEPVRLPCKGLSPEQELEQLRKENRLLKMEREILKKAAAFFAKETG